MKMRIKKKSMAVVLCGIFATVGILGYGWMNNKIPYSVNQRVTAVQGEEGVVFRIGNEEEKRMTITCNVDWGEEEIPKILDTLDEKGVKITFFVSGRWAEQNKDMLRRMYLKGHEIQSHGYGHKLSTKISVEEEKKEILNTETAIEAILGEKTTIYAPPSGDYDKDTVSLCRELGYKLSLWSADTIDWRQGSTADVITERIAKKPMKGAIVLMHPKPETVKALPQIIDMIKAQNIEIVTMSELIMV